MTQVGFVRSGPMLVTHIDGDVCMLYVALPACILNLPLQLFENVALSSATQHAMPPEFGGKCGTEVF